MVTPRDVKKKIQEYVDGEATLEEVKALVAQTTFTHNPLQVYGTDPYWDPDSWEDVRSVHRLSYEDRNELAKLVRFRDDSRPDDREA